MNVDWVERHLYDAAGHTGNTYYIRIVRRSDSKIWDPSNEVMKDVEDITWAGSVTLLVEEGLTGVFPIIIPKDWRTRDDIARASYGAAHADLTDAQRTLVNTEFDVIKNLPAGTYDIIVYVQLGSGPANSDDVEKQFETKVGDIFGF